MKDVFDSECSKKNKKVFTHFDSVFGMQWDSAERAVLFEVRTNDNNVCWIPFWGLLFLAGDIQYSDNLQGVTSMPFVCVSCPIPHTTKCLHSWSNLKHKSVKIYFHFALRVFVCKRVHFQTKHPDWSNFLLGLTWSCFKHCKGRSLSPIVPKRRRNSEFPAQQQKIGQKRTSRNNTSHILCENKCARQQGLESSICLRKWQFFSSGASSSSSFDKQCWGRSLFTIGSFCLEAVSQRAGRCDTCQGLSACAGYERRAPGSRAEPPTPNASCKSVPLQLRPQAWRAASTLGILFTQGSFFCSNVFLSLLFLASLKNVHFLWGLVRLKTSQPRRRLSLSSVAVGLPLQTKKSESSFTFITSRPSRL